MIKINSRLIASDNSGARIVKCVHVYKKKLLTGSLGDVILVSVQTYNPKKNIKKGELYKAIIIRTKYNLKDGLSNVRFNDNSVVLINNRSLPIGTRAFGITSKHLRIYNLKVFLMLPYST